MKETICLGCYRLGSYAGRRVKYCEESRAQLPDGKTSHLWVPLESLEGRQAVAHLRWLRDEAVARVMASGIAKADIDSRELVGPVGLAQAEVWLALYDLGFADESIRLEQAPGSRVSGYVVSKRFLGMAQMDRQCWLEGHLRLRLGDDYQRYVNTILTLDSSEAGEGVTCQGCGEPVVSTVALAYGRRTGVWRCAGTHCARAQMMLVGGKRE